MEISVSRSDLLEFFDESPDDSTTHATSITAIAGEELGIGLFKHFLESRGHTVKILQQTPTQGTKSGSRLDRWVYVEGDESSILYQVEIKNWSSHSIGGRRVSKSLSVEHHRLDRWRHYSKALHNSEDSALGKVLIPMKPPAQYSDVPIRPLACVWDALHPDGGSEPFFSVPLASKAFPDIWFFSMSNYLRSTDQATINIEMPAASARVLWLKRLFPDI